MIGGRACSSGRGCRKYRGAGLFLRRPLIHGRDSNPYGVPPTRLVAARVCQFRHRDVSWEGNQGAESTQALDRFGTVRDLRGGRPLRRSRFTSVTPPTFSTQGSCTLR
jgi:hypothetical protein